MYGTREEFEYFKCIECGCLQINLIPTNITKYYPKDYYSFQAEADVYSRRSALGVVLRKCLTRKSLFGTGLLRAKVASKLVIEPKEVGNVKSLLRHCGVNSFSASFLDVGCGTQSWWLNDLRSVGFKHLKGIDPFIGSDRSYKNITIKCGSIADINEKFDVITMHHSLEHAPDQVVTLNTANKLLKPGGCLIVRIPIVSSDVWQKYTTNWVELDAPRHLYLHSFESIQISGKKAELVLDHYFCDALPFEFWGSEQYVRGIPLRAANSFSVNPDESDFTYKEMASFKRDANTANANGRGGRGVFFFRAKL